MDELKPCPFCAKGETTVQEKTYWTGMRSVILSVEVQHWCEREEGQLSPRRLVFAGKGREAAIKAWNTRTPGKEGSKMTDEELIKEYHEMGLETLLSEQQFIKWYRDGQDKECEALKAENERLRKALGDAAKTIDLIVALTTVQHDKITTHITAEKILSTRKNLEAILKDRG